MSQPALSRQISNLERTVGSPLFDRRSRPVLTPQGRALLPGARAVLAAFDDLGVVGTDLLKGDVGQIRVGAVHSLTVRVIPALLREWIATHPRIEVHLDEYQNVRDMADAMSHGLLDIALGPAPPGWPGTVEPLFRERFVVAMSHDHRLATSEPTIELRDTASERWVHYHHGHALAAVLDDACAASGFTPQVAIRVQQTAVAPLLAAAGGGLAFVPDNAIPDDFRGRVRTVTPTIDRHIVAFAGRQIDPLCRHLVAMVRLQRPSGQ